MLYCVQIYLRICNANNRRCCNDFLKDSGKLVYKFEGKVVLFIV